MGPLASFSDLLHWLRSRETLYSPDTAHSCFFLPAVPGLRAGQKQAAANEPTNYHGGGGPFRVFLAVSPSKACPSPMHHHEHTRHKGEGAGRRLAQS